MAINDPGRIVTRPLLLYLYSAKNIWGSGLALLGLALFFAGVTSGWFWPFVVVGMYGVGALLGPQQRAIELSGDSLDPDDIRRQLQKQLALINKRVPSEILAKVQGIANTINEIVPHYSEFPAGSPELFVVGRTAMDYLPAALTAYINLPRAYATMHKMPNGKTADQVLSDQLDLLAAKMNDVADAVHKKDADALMASSRFLEDKFGRSSLSLPGTPA